MEELICELDKQKIMGMSEEDIIEGFKALYQTDEVERISNDPIYLVKILPENNLWEKVKGKEENLKEELDSAFEEPLLNEKARFIKDSQEVPEKNKRFIIERLGDNEGTLEKPDEHDLWEKKQINYDSRNLLLELPAAPKRMPLGIVTIDTGINQDHPDFGNILWRAEKDLEILIKNKPLKFPKGSFGFDVFNVDKEVERGLPVDTDNHGTAIAGIIGAQGIGIARFNNFPVQLLAVKAFGSQGKFEDTTTIIMALDFITEARKVLGDANILDLCVVNMSFGYFKRDNENFSKTIEDKIKKMADDGIIFVCSSGNNGKNVDGIIDDTDFTFYPSGIDSDGVISVAATTLEGVLWNSSNFGEKSVHIAAPGEQVFTTKAEGANSRFSGTSMAAPFVSASVALLLLKEPQLKKERVKEILIDNANKLPNLKVKSQGKLNISGSIANIKGRGAGA